MRAVYVPAADMNRRDNDTVRGNQSHKIADGRDVRDGVHGPHFVEVDLRHRHAVRPALGIRDEPVDRENIVLHSVLDVQTADDGLDVCHGGVVMVAVVMAMVVVVVVIMVMAVIMLVVMVVTMVVTMIMAVPMLMLVVMAMIVLMAMLMLMVMAMVVLMAMLMLMVILMVVLMAMLIIMLSITQQVSLLHTIDFYTDVSAGDAALDRRCGLEPDTGYTNRVQFSHALIFIGNNFQQGCCQHVTRSSHTAFKI